MKHPMQPIIRQPDGVLRYKRNQIVVDLMRIATEMGFDQPSTTDEDADQLQQLLGSSVHPDTHVDHRRGKHPMQPIVWVGKVIRFQRNKIVRDLLNFTTHGDYVTDGLIIAGGFSLNTICGSAMATAYGTVGPYSVEDREQFAQLIGYSVSGYGDLSYVRRSTVREADAKADNLLEERR